MSRLQPRHGVVAAVALVPVLAAWVLFGSTLVDDAHITYFAAEMVGSAGQVLNYERLPLEQSSSLLHVLLLGALHAVTGVPVATLGWWVGIVAAGALVVVSYNIARATLGADVSSAVVAASLVATSSAVVTWAVGGLETTLAALVFLLALWTWAWAVDEGLGARRRVVVACAVSSGLYLLVRPEAIAVLPATIVGLVVVMAIRPDLARPTASARRVARIWQSVAGPVVGLAVATVVVLAGRALVFGSVLPLPAATKGGGVHVIRGLQYLRLRVPDAPGAGLVLLGAAVVLVLALAGRGQHRRTPAPSHARPAAVILALGALAVLAFTVAAGGDWMPGLRLLVPAVAPAAIVTAVLVGRRRLLAVGLVFVQLLGMAFVARDDRVGTPVWARSQLRDVAVAVQAESAPWALRTSRIGLRDLATVAPLRSVVADVGSELGRPVEVASFQAGFLAASLELSLGDDVVFVDLARLTSRRFDDCARVTRDSIFGRVVDPAAWLAGSPPCGVDHLPDVLFGLGQLDDVPAWSGSYATVHETRGSLRTAGSLAGRRLPGRQFVAVRRDLEGVIGSLPPPVDFQRLLP